MSAISSTSTILYSAMSKEDYQAAVKEARKAAREAAEAAGEDPTEAAKAATQEIKDALKEEKAAAESTTVTVAADTSTNTNTSSNTNTNTGTETTVTEVKVGSETKVSVSGGGSTSYRVNKSDEEIVSSVMTNYEPEEREDTVNAEDFVRKAAIAAQAELKTKSLLEGLESNAFSKVSLFKVDASEAYAKSYASERPAAREGVSA